MNTTIEYPPRHIPGFRPLVPGEVWHRTDWTPDMLPEGCRPLLLGEKTEAIDEFPLNASRAGNWRILNTSYGPALERDMHFRTRRPLPPPPPTFEYDGKTWNSRVPGDPCPVDGPIELVFSDLSVAGFINARILDWGADEVCTYPKIGYRIPDAEPQDESAKLRERIAELESALTESDDEGTKALLKISQLEQRLAYLQADYSAAEKATDNVMRILPELNQSPSWEDAANNVRKYIDGLEQQLADEKSLTQELTNNLQRAADNIDEWRFRARKENDRYLLQLEKTGSLNRQLATALTPRPIAEEGPAKEGFVRLYGRRSKPSAKEILTFDTRRFHDSNFFIDIRLPEPDPRAEYDRAVAEAGGPFEAWLKAKGGVK